MQTSQKTLPTIVLIGLLLLFANGCSSGDPSAIVKKFDVALKKDDYKTLGQISTPETAKILSDSGEEIKKLILMAGGIKSCKQTIDGNIAKVDVTYQNGGGQTFDLKMIDGKWKIHIDPYGW